VLLTISTDISGADMGYLLHKNPARLHSFELPFGKAHVFYPSRGDKRSEAALLLDVDPIGLVRRSHGTEIGLHQYVNDRPYAASSFLSVAISQVFGTAMGGRSKERQELADQPLAFDALIAALPCRGGKELLNRLFEPLGYEIEAKQSNGADANTCGSSTVRNTHSKKTFSDCATEVWEQNAPFHFGSLR
jgi:3' terminal RNA ribose 2'-O-methyltransferase Hen1